MMNRAKAEFRSGTPAESARKILSKMATQQAKASQADAAERSEQAETKAEKKK